MRIGVIRWAALMLLAFVGPGYLTVCAEGMFQKPAAQTREVVISGFKFQPDVLTVNAGDTVEWKNADIVPHTVTALDKSFNSGKIAPGSSWRFVAKNVGEFRYTCTPHPNMHATLIVH